jgi:hypothetical protein
VKKNAGISRKRERVAARMPFLEVSLMHEIRGTYLPIKSHTLYIEISTSAYLIGTNDVNKIEGNTIQLNIKIFDDKRSNCV